jgi:nitrite reductase (NADH) large subunit
LLAADLDEDTALRYLDRFLMYYIHTADRLTRTSVWLENMEGGIERLRDVVVHDKLEICADLERQMQELVDAYRCEWTEVVNDPARRRLFRQFVNTDETEPGIEIVTERGQQRPADWPKDPPLVQIASPPRKAKPSNAASPRAKPDARPQWVPVGQVADFPLEGGAAIKYGNVQIAVFRFASRDAWYACQNMCPHKRAFVLASGIIGSQGDVPKVACPLHKKTFALTTGECLTGNELAVKVFPVKVEGDQVCLLLPPRDQLDALLATELHCVTSSEAGACELAETCANAD